MQESLRTSAAHSGAHAVRPHGATAARGRRSRRTVSGEEAEYVLMAPTPEAYRAILAGATARALSAAKLPALRAVLLRGDIEAINAILALPGMDGVSAVVNSFLYLLPGEESYNLFSSSVRPFGNSTAKWLGIDTSIENRGAGVTIALLDTAVNTNVSSLKNASITTINLFNLTQDGAENGHGTMVASIIAGNNADVGGLAPAASIISIPVIDGDGYGYSFDLATAIVTAADCDAQIISLSLGTDSYDALVAAAVDYATAKGVAIVAAAGNDGQSSDGSDNILFPASLDSVIAVGAVDADGIAADFSSTGEQLDLIAPGVGLTTQDSSGDTSSFNGTSAAAPCVAAVIAYVMALNPELTAAEAAERVLAYSDDSGLPGTDSTYGDGILNAQRSAYANTAGINDPATAGIAYTQNDDGSFSIYISAQNRGTEIANSFGLSYAIATNGDTSNATINRTTFSDVVPRQVVSTTVTVNATPGTEFSIASKVIANNDDNIDNNSKTATLVIK